MKSPLQGLFEDHFANDHLGKKEFFMVLLWIEFILCSAVIVLCGKNLCRYGDVLAEKTGLGRAWIGLVLMASVTSLPELITGISSVALAHAPDIALGDVMGSCAFNLAIMAYVVNIYLLYALRVSK